MSNLLIRGAEPRTLVGTIAARHLSKIMLTMVGTVQTITSAYGIWTAWG